MKKDIKTAEKETKEAYNATFAAAKKASGKGKEKLVRAVENIEKAEAEIEEVEEFE